MNRRVLASAIAALLIGSGIGATVGSVAAKPSGKTVTVVIVHKKKGKTRWKTRVVVHTKTKTVTKIVTGHPPPKVRKYPGCPTEQTDPANCVPPPDPSNPPADFCQTGHQCIANWDHGLGFATMCNDGEWSMSGGRPGVCSQNSGDSHYP